jgi:hypothetical protein
MAKGDPKQTIEGEVLDVLSLEKQLEEAEAELMKVDQFVRFMQLQKKVKDQATLLWETVKNEMIANDVKSIKGDWGSVTIAERLDWTVDKDLLPPKYFKKEVDKTKLSATFRLEGKAPKGAEPKYTKYLTKRIK